MPSYEFKCKGCGREVEFLMTVSNYENFIPGPCKKCSGSLRRNFTTSQATKVFRADWYRDIASEPIWITSKKQLREECEKHGGISRHVEDSFNRNF